ncbi:hypothetical protein [Streptomyces sp. NPDC018584]|uniref:hypothetical protein n=1 Tax=unclassified Streptomyces TaxID=2593676 RepID=UPI0037B8E4FA
MTATSSTAQTFHGALLVDRVHAVVTGYDLVHEAPLFAQEVLDSPRLAMQWLDDRLRHFNSLAPTLESQWRPLIRGLRGDLRRRQEWLDGQMHRVYSVDATCSSIWLRGYLCPVRSLPLLTPCLHLKTAS